MSRENDTPSPEVAEATDPIAEQENNPLSVLVIEMTEGTTHYDSTKEFDSEHEKADDKVLPIQDVEPDLAADDENDLVTAVLKGSITHYANQSKSLIKFIDDNLESLDKTDDVIEFQNDTGENKHSGNEDEITWNFSLECNICHKVFGKSAALKRHLTIHSGEKPFTCIICNKGFRMRSLLRSHEWSHNPSPRPHPCMICSKSFMTRLKLQRHLDVHERLIERGVKRYICGVCGKEFRRSSTLRRHEEIHMDFKPFECGTCGKLFARKERLARHSLVHTRETPYPCKTCGRRFRHQSNLYKHHKIHTDEKPHECNVCLQRFKDKAYLNKHIQTHNRENLRPGKETPAPFFNCMGCGKQFTTKFSLMRHHYTVCDPDKATKHPTRTIISSRPKRAIKLPSIHPTELPDIKPPKLPVIKQTKLPNVKTRKPSQYKICHKALKALMALKKRGQICKSKKPHKCALFEMLSSISDSNRDEPTPASVYTCTFCFRIFMKKSELQRHCLSHSDGTPFACHICPSRFSDQPSLISHINGIHKHEAHVDLKNTEVLMEHINSSQGNQTFRNSIKLTPISRPLHANSTYTNKIEDSCPEIIVPNLVEDITGAF